MGVSLPRRERPSDTHVLVKGPLEREQCGLPPFTTTSLIFHFNTLSDASQLCTSAQSTTTRTITFVPGDPLNSSHGHTSPGIMCRFLYSAHRLFIARSHSIPQFASLLRRAVEPSSTTAMFDLPELVAHLVPYLTLQDMARCIATCKALASIFEPYLYRQIVLGYKHSSLPALPRNLQHVRTLEIYGQLASQHLEALSAALNSTEAETTPKTMAFQVPILLTKMIRLQKLTVSTVGGDGGSDNYSVRALYTLLSILDNSSITHLQLQMYTDMTDAFIMAPRLLKVLRTGLPRLQQLDISGCGPSLIPQAIEVLKICFAHPSLTHVQFDTHEWGDDGQIPSTLDRKQFDSLLEFLKEQAKMDVQFRGGVNGCRWISLALPYLNRGYPRSLLLPLLKTYLPRLERFHVPELDGSYAQELEEVMADHCSHLQHISYSFPIHGRTRDSSVIKAAIRGCAEGSGLKSIRIFGYDNQLDSYTGVLIEMLVEHHAKTLESVELKAWRRRRGTCQLGRIFTGCPNLKSLKVVPLDGKDAIHWLRFSHTPADPWVFRGMKELHLHFAQMDQYQRNLERTKRELEAGERMFKRIGELVHLEVLVLDYIYHCKVTLSEWDLDKDIEYKWARELAGLDKLRCLYMSYDFWSEEHLSDIIDSSWPRLERISSKDFSPAYPEAKANVFQWVKLRRPWLKVGFHE